MIGCLFGGNIGISAGVFFFLFLIGLITGLLIRSILKTLFVIIVLLLLCSFFGVVGVNWPLIVGTIGAVTLILISLLLTVLPFTIGFILGIILSIKRRGR